MGRKRKSTKAQMRMKYYDATKRLGTVHHPYYDNKVMPPYPLAPPPFYVSHTSYPLNAYGRRFSAPPSSHLQEVNSQDVDIDIPAAVTKEEDDDPKSLDNKRIIANSVPSSELEIALKAELDKEVKYSERISAELDKLRHVLSRIQAHQSYEPLPPHGASLHSSQSRSDRSEQRPAQPTKKGPRNGYNMFYSKVAPELKGALNSYKDLAKVISEKWSYLSKEEKDNYELDAEIFNIMDDRDTRNSNNTSNGDDQRLSLNEHKQYNSYDDRDDQHLYYPTNPPYQYQYDMTIPPPPGPPPGPPPPGMLFDPSVPPPPPPPGYDYSVLPPPPPPPPPNDMFSGGIHPPPPNYTDMNRPSSASALNFEDSTDSPSLPLNRSLSLI